MVAAAQGPKRYLDVRLAPALAMQIYRARHPSPVASTAWPSEYRNADTGKIYQPHHLGEQEFVYSDTPRAYLVRGGEGAGKSVCGIIKDLERLRRGCDGILVSPDLPHFKKSLWPEFRRWCPWEMVVPSQRHRQEKHWQPGGSFVLNFLTGACLYCGGIDDPSGWHGPNVNFAHFDEARRKRTAEALKVLDGRVRIPGPHGEPPQFWITTTPRKNWLFDLFGPLQPDDPWAQFKDHARDLVLRTIDNESNLIDGYVEQRSASLTEAERRVYMEAEWEDEETSERFLESMLWWDSCQESLPPLGHKEPLVLAMDAGVSHDSFALVGVTRHPTRHADCAVRYARNWKAPGGGKEIDFSQPEQEIRRLCHEYNVVQVAYDPYQLVDLSQRLYRERVGWFAEFGQGPARLEADKHLLDIILARRLTHNGEMAELRAHLDHADRKLDPESRKLRIVKREPGLLIDLAVCLSMSAYRCLITLANM